MNDNLTIVLQYMELIAKGDIEGALALCADDAVFQGPTGQRTDKHGLRAMFAQLRPLLINPLHQTVLGTTSEGQRVAVEAEASTLLANGKTYSNIYHFLFEVDEGRITASREYCDTTRATAFQG